MMIAWSGSPGALPLRLLAEQTGLRAGLSAAMTRHGFTPIYDRGQVLLDLAVAQILGGEAISDFQGLRHLGPVIGPVLVDRRQRVDVIPPRARAGGCPACRERRARCCAGPVPPS